MQLIYKEIGTKTKLYKLEWKLLYWFDVTLCLLINIILFLLKSLNMKTSQYMFSNCYFFLEISTPWIFNDCTVNEISLHKSSEIKYAPSTQILIIIWKILTVCDYTLSDSHITLSMNILVWLETISSILFLLASVSSS